MRYEKGHKEETRRKIVETAAARFRRDGIEAVGIADLMAELGLTHGGFYSHFKSKEDLIKEAMIEATEYSGVNFRRRIEEGGLEAWIRAYLRTGHRDHPEKGCAMAARASEVVRHPKATRASFSERIGTLIGEIATHLPHIKSATARRQRATGIFGVLVGTMQMSRAVTEPELSNEILEAGITSALTLAQA